MLLLFYLVGCTFHFVLLKRHLKAVFHSILFSVHILFIRIFSIRILFICILFIRIIFIRILFIHILLIGILFILIIFIHILFIRPWRYNMIRQKQPPEVSIKFHNIHRKTTVLEPLFSKVAGLKRNYNTRVFLWVLRNFQEFSLCKRLLLIRILLHFIHAISNDSGIVTKLPETFRLFLVKSKYRLTLTQRFC